MTVLMVAAAYRDEVPAVLLDDVDDLANLHGATEVACSAGRAALGAQELTQVHALNRARRAQMMGISRDR
jgi:hypothetical protein